MATKILTVEDILKKIQSLKKDIEYVTELQEKWRDQKSAFPLICEGIRKQIESLKERVTQLKTLKVEMIPDTPQLEEPPKQEVQNLREETRLAPESVRR